MRAVILLAWWFTIAGLHIGPYETKKLCEESRDRIVSRIYDHPSGHLVETARIHCWHYQRRIE